MNNINKLASKIAAFEGIPVGADIHDGIEFLLDPSLPKKLSAAKAKANFWIDAIIKTDNNPYGEDREAIAAAIIAKIEEKTKEYDDSI